MKNNKTINALNSLLLMILSLGLIGATHAQSTDQSAPMVFTSNEVSGKGPSKETNYYYSFTGGPGEVTVSLNIKAKQYSTFARLEVLDAEFNTLATHNMNATTGSGPVQVMKKIGLSEKQTVLIKVTLDGNLTEYKIKLGGAVELGSAPPVETPVDAGNSSSTPSNDESSVVPDAAAEAPKKEKKFSLDYKSKIAMLKDLGTSGTLIILMKDGSTQEVLLKNVKGITLRP
jgi:hypothetical protein